MKKILTLIMSILCLIVLITPITAEDLTAAASPLVKPVITLTADFYMINVKVTNVDPEAEGYQVQASTNGKKWSNRGLLAIGSLKVDGSGLVYENRSLANNKKYYYRVRSYTTNAAGKLVYSAWSATKSIKTKKDTSKAVISLNPSTVPVLKDKTASSIEINMPQHEWLVYSHIYRGTSKKKIKTLVAKDLSGDVLTWVDTGLKANTVYYYRVVSWFMINGKWVKKTSAIVSRRTAPIDMAMPKNLTVANQTGGVSVKVDTWNNSVEFDSINILRSTNKKSWSKVGTLSSGDFVFVDKSAKNKTTYYYKVEIVKAGKKIVTGIKSLKTNIPAAPVACKGGIDPSKPCDYISDAAYNDDRKWGVYPTLEAATIAGDAFLDEYHYFATEHWVDSWFATSFVDNGYNDRGYVLFLRREGVFVPPHPDVVVYDWTKE